MKMKILLNKLLYCVCGIGMFLFIFVAFANAAQGLWYNGDWNSGMYSNFYSSSGSYIIYDDFEVTDTNGWIIETVWSNVALRIESEVTLAFWEIRSGVSAGDGGTLLYSGIDMVTKEATGRSIVGDPEYSLKITGLNISLPQGRYWLAVAPDWDGVTGGNYTALVGTIGLNAVGSPAGNNGNSFLNWPGRFFESTTPVFPHDFSMGVEGSIIPDIVSPFPDAKNEVVYPNPYIKGKTTTERISFANLPKEATIRIYTISGKLIKTIKHKDTADGGSEEWEISGISSGIYLYTIISPEGKKTGKVSIIK